MNMDGVDWNSGTLELRMGGRVIHVPYMQAVLLTELLARSDRYTATRHLAKRLYGDGPEVRKMTQVTDIQKVGVLIRSLRRTLNGSGLSIHNKYGAGYRLLREA